MDPHRHRREVEVFTSACDLPPEAQEELLRRECGEDASMIARVRSLLVRDATGRDRFELPGLESVSTGILEEETPERIGRYRILRVLGRGGMGIVYEAEQERSTRPVALKVLQPGLESARTLRRFEHEARILARLSHPGIAQVLDAGVSSSALGPRPYLVMELVRGEPLTRFADRNALDPRRRLELLANVCDAVQHAHEKGVIHRDLKPSNLLVSEDGAPKVLDFGIARVLDQGATETSLRTRTGELLGTLAYMSPEQITGDADAVDTRSDVYSLGVIAYELLSGRLPHDVASRSFPDAARRILEEEPTRLGSVARAFRGDVETIVGKAMEKERVRRYASAGELGRDLRRFLAHEPIAARPASGFYQLRRFARRNRKVTAALAVAAAALIAGTVASWKSAIDARGEMRRAESLSVRANLSAAAFAIEGRDPVSARQMLAAVGAADRGWAWRHLEAAIDGSAASFEDDAPIHDAAAIENGEVIETVSAAGKIRRWSTRSGDLLGTLTLGPPNLAAAAFSPDGAWVVGVQGDERKEVAVWNASTGALRGTLAAPEAVVVAAVACGGEVAAVGGSKLDLWRTDSCDPPASVSIRHPARLAFDPGGSPTLAVGYGDAPEHSPGWGWVIEIDAGTGTITRAAHQFSDQKILGIAIDHGGTRIAAASFDRRVYLMGGAGSVRPPLRENGLAGHRAEATCVAFDRDGRRLASGSADQTVRVWDPSNGAEIAVLTGASGVISHLGFLPGGTGVFGTCGARLHLWTLAEDPYLTVLAGHASYVYGVAFLENGRRIVSGAWDGTLRVWDARTRECFGSRATGSERILALAADPSGRWFATAEPKHLRLWNPDTAEITAELPLGGAGRRADDAGDVVALSTSRDGELLAARTFKGVRILRTRDGTVDREIPIGRSGHRSTIALSPDGRWVAADAGPKQITVWDRASGAVVARLLGHSGDVESLAFSPSGALLASGSTDTTVRLWETASWTQTFVLAGHTDRVYSLAFSPDGSRLASGSNDATIRVWQPSDGVARATLRGHRDYVYALAFSPDGECLASASGDGTVRLWETRPLRDVWSARVRARRLETEARASIGAGDDATAIPVLVERMRSGATPDPDAREAALRLLLRRALAADPTR